MAANSTPISGKFGRFKVGSVSLAFDRWKVTPRSNDIPTTNFEDIDVNNNTFSSGITGVIEADLEGNGYYDTDNTKKPFSVLFLKPGNLTPANPGVKLYIDKRDENAAFVFPSIRILQAPVDVDVNGRANFALVAKSNGPYTFPS